MIKVINPPRSQKEQDLPMNIGRSKKDIVTLERDFGESISDRVEMGCLQAWHLQHVDRSTGVLGSLGQCSGAVGRQEAPPRPGRREHGCVRARGRGPWQGFVLSGCGGQAHAELQTLLPRASPLPGQGKGRGEKGKRPRYRAWERRARARAQESEVRVSSTRIAARSGIGHRPGGCCTRGGFRGRAEQASIPSTTRWRDMGQVGDVRGEAQGAVRPQELGLTLSLGAFVRSRPWGCGGAHRWGSS